MRSAFGVREDFVPPHRKSEHVNWNQYTHRLCCRAWTARLVLRLHIASCLDDFAHPAESFRLFSYRANFQYSRFFARGPISLSCNLLCSIVATTPFPLNPLEHLVGSERR